MCATTSCFVQEHAFESAQILEQILDMLVSLAVRKSVVVQETSQEHRSGARQGPVGAADRHSRFLT